MTWIRLMRSGLVRVLFVHVLQSRPWNALHYWPVASDKLKVGGFRFLINVHHGQYPVVALSGNAIVLPWNAECHVPSLRRPYRHSRGREFQTAPLPDCWRNIAITQVIPIAKSVDRPPTTKTVREPCAVAARCSAAHTMTCFLHAVQSNVV